MTASSAAAEVCSRTPPPQLTPACTPLPCLPCRRLPLDVASRTTASSQTGLGRRDAPPNCVLGPHTPRAVSLYDIYKFWPSHRAPPTPTPPQTLPPRFKATLVVLVQGHLKLLASGGRPATRCCCSHSSTASTSAPRPLAWAHCLSQPRTCGTRGSPPPDGSLAELERARRGRGSPRLLRLADARGHADTRAHRGVCSLAGQGSQSWQGRVRNQHFQFFHLNSSAAPPGASGCEARPPCGVVAGAKFPEFSRPWLYTVLLPVVGDTAMLVTPPERSKPVPRLLVIHFGDAAVRPRRPWLYILLLSVP